MGSGDAVSHVPFQVVIWPSAWLVFIGVMEINFSEIKIKQFWHIYKSIWKRRLQNDGYFVSDSIGYKEPCMR